MNISNTLRHKAILGIVWSAMSQIGSQSIHYVVLLVLAWLLTPTAFGLAGLAMLYIRFAQGFSEFSLTAALVQQPEVEEPLLSTAFWSSLSVSILMAGLTYLSANSLANFLGNDDATPMLQSLCILFPIMALGQVPWALRERELEFNQLSKREMASEIAFGIVALVMAFSGAGAWSLVIAAIAQSTASTAMLWRLTPWRPSIQFDLQKLKFLLKFGIPVIASNTLHRAMINADYFVVGRWFGTEALGYYTLAYTLTVVPGQRLITIVRRVAFPSLSRMQGDPKRLQQGFAEGAQHLFVALLPLMLIGVFLGPWFIRAMYGSKWLPSTPSLQILSIAALFYGFDIAQSLYYALGQPTIRVWLMGGRLALFAFFTFILGFKSGFTAVALSVTLSVAISAVLGYAHMARLLKVSLSELFQPLRLSVRAGIIAAVIPIVATLVYPLSTQSPQQILFLLGPIMLGVYTLSLIPTYLPMVKQVVNSILGRAVVRLHQESKFTQNG